MRRGLAPSREQAHAQISARRVRVSGAIADKPSRLVGPDEPVFLSGAPPRFVSRGGDKLDAALDTLEIDVAGSVALDAGASTGGFTDCLLQRGAARVIAIDVGRGQLDQRLRNDARVDVRERVNARHLELSDIGAPVDLVVADLSFISLTAVLPALASVVKPGGDLVLLVKPQFEAGRAEVSRGKGVVRDPQVWAAAVARVSDAIEGLGAAIIGHMVSPLKGADGNVEFFTHARSPEAPG